ncbi:MAG: hypothetical protein ACJ797_14600, partial [Ktedonobacteraceae bacterium]
MDTQLLIEEVIHDEQIEIDVRNAQRDLIILKYMAWRLNSILYQLDQAEKQRSEQPLPRQVQERWGRNHRIVIYRQQELLQLRSFAFVGFISKRKGVLQPEVVEAIKQTVRYSLYKQGHTPHFFGSTVETGSHQRSIEMVIQGKVEAAAIDSLVLDLFLLD